SSDAPPCFPRRSTRRRAEGLLHVRTSTKPAARGTRPLRRWAAAEDFFAQPRFGGRHPLILESCERPHAMDGRRYGGRAEFYEAFNEPMERGGLAAVRARMACALSGAVPPKGCGAGGRFVLV